jgi:uncharacterized protein with PQ loop repeat
MITDILGYFGGFLCVITMFPQIYKMIQTKKSDDISYGFLIIGPMSTVIWIAYGIMKPDYVILTTDSIILVVQLFSFYITWKYKKKKLKIDDTVHEDVIEADIAGE